MTSEPYKTLMKGMLRIRYFEERVLDEFSKGHLFGTTHTCIGQEANAVGVVGALARTDVVFSNHRCHGHFLAHGGSMYALAAELMGRSTGVCGGIGGSQHLHAEGFYSNGIQGGIAPCATGIALAEKLKNSRAIVAVFLGDGTFGEGVVYESLNIASLWKLPMFFVVEDNRYAQTTPLELNFAGEFALRFHAFGIKSTELCTTDVTLIREAAARLIPAVRESRSPQAIILHTYRLAPHSKGDDVRDPAEIERHREFDPIFVLRPHLHMADLEEIQAIALQEVNEAFCEAEKAPISDPAGVLDTRKELLKS